MPFRLDRAFIRVSGPDAVSFLDNLLTQDVTKLDRVQYAALLSPQGKLIADMILWREGPDSVILDLDPARKADILRRLTLYKLRAQVTLEEITEQFHLLAAPDYFEGASQDPRFSDGALGFRKISQPSASASDEKAYESHRLTLGVPDLARDCAPEEVFAGEALLEELHGVDFHKGCFVGQENTSRMKRRATTRKKFCPISFEGPPPAYGAVIQAGEAEIGQVRTGMEGRAMALVRLDRALQAPQLTAQGRAIRLDPPPWLILPRREGSGD